MCPLGCTYYYTLTRFASLSENYVLSCCCAHLLTFDFGGDLCHRTEPRHVQTGFVGNLPPLNPPPPPRPAQSDITLPILTFYYLVLFFLLQQSSAWFFFSADKYVNGNRSFQSYVPLSAHVVFFEVSAERYLMTTMSHVLVKPVNNSNSVSEQLLAFYLLAEKSYIQLSTKKNRLLARIFSIRPKPGCLVRITDWQDRVDTQFFFGAFEISNVRAHYVSSRIRDQEFAYTFTYKQNSDLGF